MQKGGILRFNQPRNLSLTCRKAIRCRTAVSRTKIYKLQATAQCIKSWCFMARHLKWTRNSSCSSLYSAFSRERQISMWTYIWTQECRLVSADMLSTRKTALTISQVDNTGVKELILTLFYVKLRFSWTGNLRYFISGKQPIRTSHKENLLD